MTNAKITTVLFALTGAASLSGLMFVEGLGLLSFLLGSGLGVGLGCISYAFHALFVSGHQAPVAKYTIVGAFLCVLFGLISFNINQQYKWITRLMKPGNVQSVDISQNNKAVHLDGNEVVKFFSSARYETVSHKVSSAKIEIQISYNGGTTERVEGKIFPDNLNRALFEIPIGLLGGYCGIDLPIFPNGFSFYQGNFIPGETSGRDWRCDCENSVPMFTSDPNPYHKDVTYIRQDMFDIGGSNEWGNHVRGCLVCEFAKREQHE